MTELIVQDVDGELAILFTEDLLGKLGAKAGDILNAEDLGDGRVRLTKAMAAESDTTG